MIVKTDEFVAALKSLKVNQKRRRKLNILIRHGAGVGELILELSGRSPIAGALTTVYGDGDWPKDVRVPAASLCGLMLHPPADQNLHISVIDGRFCFGPWSCPAK